MTIKKRLASTLLAAASIVLVGAANAQTEKMGAARPQQRPSRRSRHTR